MGLWGYKWKYFIWFASRTVWGRSLWTLVSGPSSVEKKKENTSWINPLLVKKQQSKRGSLLFVTDETNSDACTPPSRKDWGYGRPAWRAAGKDFRERHPRNPRLRWTGGIPPKRIPENQNREQKAEYPTAHNARIVLNHEISRLRTGGNPNHTFLPPEQMHLQNNILDFCWKQKKTLLSSLGKNATIKKM